MAQVQNDRAGREGLEASGSVGVGAPHREKIPSNQPVDEGGLGHILAANHDQVRNVELSSQRVFADYELDEVQNLAEFAAPAVYRHGRSGIPIRMHVFCCSTRHRHENYNNGREKKPKTKQNKKSALSIAYQLLDVGLQVYSKMIKMVKIPLTAKANTGGHHPKLSQKNTSISWCFLALLSRQVSDLISLSVIDKKRSISKFVGLTGLLAVKGCICGMVSKKLARK